MKMKTALNDAIQSIRLADMDKQPGSEFFKVKTPILIVNDEKRISNNGFY